MRILRNQHGGTALELILGLVVASLITYTLAPGMGNLKNNTSLDAAAKKIELELRYAQNLAMTTLSTHGFKTRSATASKQDYWLYEVDDASNRTVLTSPHDRQEMREDLEQSFQGIEFSNDYTVEFDDKGKPTTGSDLTIVLASPVDNSGMIRKKTISIDNKTGNITTTASETLSLTATTSEVTISTTTVTTPIAPTTTLSY